MDTVIGIDLGTTNSCVAVVENGTPTVIANRGGYKTTPSVVAVTDADKRLVGHIAKRQAITNAENTVSAAKRLIGRKYSSAQVKSSMLVSSYRIVDGPHGDVRVQLRSKSYSVPELSAMVLQEMKIIAEDHVGHPVRKAVITVPAYFNDAQRQATKDAGEIAGLEVVRIINEPTAAALAYGFGRDLEKTIAVYDLGGGTFDVSLLEIGAGGVFKVVATAGDTFLGGDDFDARIIDWLIGDFQAEHGVDLRRDRIALQRLKEASEKAKCDLSTMTETVIELPFITSTGHNDALHLERTLTRDTLESLCDDLVERTIEICQQAILDAKLDVDEIEDVVLVGGMTRMPKVQATVRAFFGREASKGVHPDEVVALGAAIQGAALLEKKPTTILLDVTPHALGILLVDEQFEELIPANSAVPTTRTKVFTTSRDNQTAVKIMVMQGTAEAGKPDVLGEFTLTNLRRAPRGQVEIEVSFAINADGIVNVRAKDMETAKEQSIQVTTSSGLTRDELDKMVDSAKDFLIDHRSNEEMAATQHRAERLIADIERMSPMVEELVASSDFGRDAMSKTRDVVDQAQSAIRAQDAVALAEHVESLERAFRMYKGVVSTTQ